MKLKKMVPLLETERLILRGILPDDTDTIVHWRSDPQVYPYLLSPHVISKQEHMAWYQNLYLNDRSRFDWMCLRKDTKERIGIMGVKKDGEAKTAEISYLISPNIQRRGFGKEAVAEIINWCGAHGVVCIYAVIHEENQKSITFIENMGFSPMTKKEPFITYRKD